jgi:hypothetical protein
MFATPVLTTVYPAPITIIASLVSLNFGEFVVNTTVQITALDKAVVQKEIATHVNLTGMELNVTKAASFV